MDYITIINKVYSIKTISNRVFTLSSHFVTRLDHGQNFPPNIHEHPFGTNRSKFFNSADLNIYSKNIFTVKFI